jgi:hypothetical protein
MAVERLHDVREVICPYCHERGSLTLIINNQEMLIRFMVGPYVYYLHQKCMMPIVQEWLGKYGPKHGG